MVDIGWIVAFLPSVGLFVVVIYCKCRLEHKFGVVLVAVFSLLINML